MTTLSREGMPTSAELQHYPDDAESFGYDPERGVYVSNFIFQGDWQEDLDILNEKYGYNPLQVTQQFSNQQEGRELGAIISSVAFRSTNGDPHTHRHSSEIDETPDLFQYTSAYHDMKTINKIIDWFGNGVCRARIFRQEPLKDLLMHYDFDNQRNNFDSDNQTLRVLIQLTENKNNWMRFKSKTSDITFKPEAGQVIIFNADWVWHGTVNYVNEPRDCLMMILKDQEFAKNLGKRHHSHLIEYIKV